MRTLSLAELEAVSGGWVDTEGNQHHWLEGVVPGGPQPAPGQQFYWFAAGGGGNGPSQSDAQVVENDYFDTNGQAWRDQMSCFDETQQEQIRQLIDRIRDAMGAFGAIGFSFAQVPGAFLGAVMGAFVGTIHGAVTAPNPYENCPPGGSGG